jgi:rRNA maturation RNase YbeY
MAKKTATANIRFHFLQPCPAFTKRTAAKDFLRSLFKKEKTQLQSLNYIFCSDDYLLEINKSYLSHNYYTDIITFDLSEGQGTIGEIYISLDRVRDNAAQFKTSFKQELHRVIFHGALHLCGYKDKTKADQKLIREREDYWLKKYFN